MDKPQNKTTRKIIGWIFIVIGLIAIITPFTPFGLVFLVGLKMIFPKIAMREKIQKYIEKRRKKDEF